MLTTRSSIETESLLFFTEGPNPSEVSDQGFNSTSKFYYNSISMSTNFSILVNFNLYFIDDLYSNK